MEDVQDTLPSPQQELERLDTLLWDLRDQEAAVLLARAAIMNTLKENGQETV